MSRKGYIIILVAGQVVPWLIDERNCLIRARRLSEWFTQSSGVYHCAHSGCNKISIKLAHIPIHLPDTFARMGPQAANSAISRKKTCSLSTI